MNDEAINKLKLIQDNIKNSNHNSSKPNIICVSKTFSMDKLKGLIDFGHHHFGENKVQEAEVKWTEIKKINTDLKIHMVGKLQTNKAKKAIKVFDFIHSLDNQKLADVLRKNEEESGKKISYFIQINIGNENQKSGITSKDAKDFLNYCSKENKLNVVGLMVIPPNDNKPEKYFRSLNELNKSLALQELSMGMSADYIEAVKLGSTFIRVGSSIFGERS